MTLLGERPGALVRPSALLLTAGGHELSVGSGEIGTGSGALVWGRGLDGCAPAYLEVLCQPPHSGAVLCRKGRLVKTNVVGRLPIPRFCANLHILGLCRAERGGWYRCTWLTGLRRSSREPRVPERGGRYRCTWLDACLPPGSVPTPTFWDPGPRNSSAPTCRGRACSQSTAEKLVSHRIGCIRGLRLPPAEALPYIWRSSAGVASASPSPAIVRAFSPR